MVNKNQNYCESFEIKSKPRKCYVEIGESIMNNVADYILRNSFSRIAIITDSRVKSLYSKKLVDELDKKGIISEVFSFPEGEKSKTRDVKQKIENRMLKAGYGRDCAVIGLGGGVVGDLAGFVAATYMRGVSFIQVPTTLLAMADSSYGGKTGVDTNYGKNLIGVFHQPEAVFMDINTLKTLDNRNINAGMAEIIKHGLIKDKDLFNLVKDIDLDNSRMVKEILLKNIKIKREVVISDEKEKGMRKILNYGHTIGHAVEQLSNYNLLHGEAIAIGICIEGYISYKSGLLSANNMIEQLKVFSKLGMKTAIPKNITTDKIIKSMKLDKKAINSTPRFSLIKSIGQHLDNNQGFAIEIDERSIREWIEEYRSIDPVNTDNLKNKICRCLREKTINKCIKKLTELEQKNQMKEEKEEKTKKDNHGLIEHRLDYLDEQEITKDNLTRLYSLIKAPIIATDRRKEEDGKSNRNDQQRKYVLINAIEAGCDYVDIELSMDKACINEIITKIKQKKDAKIEERKSGKYKQKGCKIIISRHYFNSTPNYKELRENLYDMVSMGCDIAKIVVMTTNPDDNNTILKLYDESILKEKNISLLAFSMGEKGKITRAESIVLGGPFTYVPIKKGTAPGQIGDGEIRKIIKNKYITN